MRPAPLRFVFLTAGALVTLGLGPTDGSADSLSDFIAKFSEVRAEPFDPPVCEPNKSCKRDCVKKARRVLNACVDDGQSQRECRQRAREFRRSCLASECRPSLDCEDRCEAHGKRLLQRCLESGGEVERCREVSESATAACIERNCHDCLCPDIYDPVCGVDGMSYGNACEASCAGARIELEGACEPRCEPLPCDVLCEFGHKVGRDGCPTCECNPPPGCRSDEDCDDDQICGQLCPTRPCFEGDPSCGGCIGFCLSRPEPEPCFCGRISLPVCGVDGMTYPNACLAGCADVDIESWGECGADDWWERPRCPLLCPGGFEVASDGRPICRCNPLSIERPFSPNAPS